MRVMNTAMEDKKKLFSVFIEEFQHWKERDLAWDRLVDRRRVVEHNIRKCLNGETKFIRNVLIDLAADWEDVMEKLDAEKSPHQLAYDAYIRARNAVGEALDGKSGLFVCGDLVVRVVEGRIDNHIEEVERLV